MKVLSFFGITLLLVSSVSPLKCYKCPRQDSTDQHCLAEGLLLGEVTICSIAETFDCRTIHKITTCYCEKDLCNGPESSGQNSISSCLLFSLGISTFESISLKVIFLFTHYLFT